MLRITAYLGKRLHDGLSKPHLGAISFKGLHSSTIGFASGLCHAFSCAWPCVYATLCVQAHGCSGRGPALVHTCTCGYLSACHIQHWLHNCLHIISKIV